MSEAVIVALISGGVSLLGILLSSRSSSQKMQNTLELHQAVTETKLEDLTREVRKHNGFAERMPRVEEQILAIKEDLRILKRG